MNLEEEENYKIFLLVKTTEYILTKHTSSPFMDEIICKGQLIHKTNRVDFFW